MRARLFGLVLFLIWFGAAPASADSTASRAAADALFREAVGLADSGDYAGAIQKFSASYELDPARGTLQGLAMAEEKQGRVLDAYTHFRELVEASIKANDSAREAAAREHLALLKVRVPTLKITFADDVPPKTRVEIDGEKLPGGAVGSALPVNPGDHHVRALAPDGRTFSLMVGVSEGARAKVEVTWKKPVVEAESEPEDASAKDVLPPPPPPHQIPESEWGSGSSDLRPLGLVVGGVGVVLAGVGSYLWISAGRDYSDLQSRCPNQTCPPGSQDKIDSGRTKENWGRIALIGGGVALAGGITLFAIGKPRAPAVEARVGPSSIDVLGRF